ncbi:hypothetical protein [Shewanella algae]|uniref:hypothetical protein n=1 Tax=Shewanella algae TaxID=38313 RepID=UPI001C561A5C|nr:hypothetical protein [Shewanella algae]
MQVTNVIITGKSPALVDMPADAVFKINHKLDKDLTTAPVKLSRASMSAIDDNTLAMTLSYEDGTEQVMLGVSMGRWWTSTWISNSLPVSA